MFKEEATKKALEFFKGDQLAADVFIKKYAVVRPDGKYDEATPEHMWKRMSHAAADVEKNKDKEKWEQEFYNILKDFKVIPGGSIMFTLGNKYSKSSLSNCFVFSVEDNIESIFDTAKEMARTYSYRGGCGLDISSLRPADALVSNAAKASTGAVSFMTLYSDITKTIGMHGRRGALLLSMSVGHPDIEAFIKAKTDLTKITGANVSVRISDKFMKSVQNNESWTAKFETKHETIKKEFKARDLWKLICDTATKYAEPGVLFWDTIKQYNPSEAYSDDGYGVAGLNPCSELSLASGESCLLVNVNLSKYTRNDFTNEATFDFDSFKKDIAVAVRFADNCKSIDAELVPLAKQKKACLDLRRIGLGVTGLADCLANLRIKYDTEQGIKFTESIFKIYTKTAYGASVELAKEKGPFPIFNAKKEKGHYFLEKIGFAGIPRRNVALITCPPTGTVSILAQSSSGIEPVFRNTYKRRVKISQGMCLKSEDKIYTDLVGDKYIEYDVYHNNVKRYLDMTKNTSLPDYFITSDEIDWKKRVEVQGVISKNIDHSISSTVNLPKGTSSDIVGKIYLEAWKSSCKGITVYVDESRDGVLVSGKKEGCSCSYKRPKKLPCDIYRVTAEGEKWLVMIGLKDNKPYEVFCGKPKVNVDEKHTKGYIEKESRGKYSLHIGENEILRDISCIFNNVQGALSRQISLSLRHDVDIQFIVQQLEKSDGEIFSFSKSISRVLKKYIIDGVKENGANCPECGGEMVRSEGCVKCVNCGWSKCG